MGNGRREIQGKWREGGNTLTGSERAVQVLEPVPLVRKIFAMAVDDEFWRWISPRPFASQGVDQRRGNGRRRRFDSLDVNGRSVLQKSRSELNPAPTGPRSARESPTSSISAFEFSKVSTVGIGGGGQLDGTIRASEGLPAPSRDSRHYLAIREALDSAMNSRGQGCAWCFLPPSSSHEESLVRALRRHAGGDHECRTSALGLRR